ncbi:nucleotide exchange factor Fes1-domain-containing protein [Tuber brumale]|nr:nucleotide exchange factor Fes1-domain-containing protein [Tuber brumale]
MSDMAKLLSWGIENSIPSDDPNTENRRTKLDPALLAQLFGANVKDDSVLMREALEAIQDPEITLENKEIAFDNLEMLVENLDNANNLENLNLWPPLIAQLSVPEQQLRFMAAWCIGTAVQNNPKSQAAMLKHGGVAKVVDLVLRDPEERVRTKAVYALSSQIRNEEESLKAAVELLPEEVLEKGRHEYRADDMEAIDELVKALRERTKKVISP